MKKIFFFLYSVIFCAGTYAQWTDQPSGTIQHLNSVFATGASDVFAAGNNGAGVKTINGGSNWINMSLGSALTHYGLRFINSTTGFTAGDAQEILKTTNSGGTWTNISGGTTTLYDCYFTTSSSGWVVGDIEVGYGFLYNPFTFNLIQIPAIANKVLRGIYFSNSTTGWVVGSGGLIIKTVNSGTAWTQQSSGTANQLNKIMFLDSNNGIAVGNAGTILKTTNGGTNWTNPSSGITQNLKAIYYADILNIWVCGDNGIILKSSDGGLTWTPETSGTTENLNAIHGIGATNIWACGNNGKIIYSSGTVPVSENSLNATFSVYPNPSDGMFYLKTGEILNGVIEIYNVTGDKIYQTEISGTLHQLNPGLSNSFYFYQIKKQQEIIGFGKIVIQ